MLSCGLLVLLCCCVVPMRVDVLLCYYLATLLMDEVVKCLMC